jgi:nitronate monooxygenase
MFAGLRLPLMCAPMSFASSVALAVACCKGGVIGGWQGGTFTPLDQFAAYLDALAAVQGAPAIVNLPARIATEATGPAKLDLLERHRVPLVLSSIGDPRLLVDRVHAWGGKVIHDVTTMRHAEKALAAGADGLMLTCAGAGGHGGFLTPFAFVPAVRRMFAGPLIVAGGIADGAGIAAALTLGADIACMGTRFIATPESGVVEGHRAMISRTGIDDIIVSAAMNGVPANWMRASLEEVGLDPAALPQARIAMPEGVKPWRDIWSAGHSVALIDDVLPVGTVIDRLALDFDAAYAGEWRQRLQRLA